MSPIKIGKYVSRFDEEIVYDKEILHYVGLNTYCRLHFSNPKIWADHPNCKHTSVSNIDLLLYEYNFTPKEVKAQLVTAIVTGKESPLVKKLKGSSLKPHSIDNSIWVNAFWISWIFLIVFTVIWYIVCSGILHSLFNEESGFFTGYPRSPKGLCHPSTKFCPVVVSKGCASR